MVCPTRHFVCTLKFFFFPSLSLLFSSFARGPLHSSLPSGLRNGSGISYSGSVVNFRCVSPVGYATTMRRKSAARLIVENSHLHILPSMNPDGCFLRRRGNVSNIDLNRDFPDQFFSLNNDINARQPETRAIMNWLREIQFAASASLHGGALVANYPWDDSEDKKLWPLRLYTNERPHVFLWEKQPCIWTYSGSRVHSQGEA
ncbi:hypothetical protein SADUNF_Sadunf02G0053200 [Salix dunnii]|uniref:Peptidase M14 domain-containing protein n=1 Tax=Salix dunnii TaxID=1413687 RepID=A0A835TIN9_9ROSI|nr:hypothetical protein SADUNF_Sadunf02G0053200 [Salix dunnii]